MNHIQVIGPRLIASLLATPFLLMASVVVAGVIDDSKASLELRNYYLNRDFRQESARQAKAAEWGQGFIARLESGYTEGSVGVGLDAIGELGIKLDSSRDRRGTGLLPFSPTSKEPVDDYSELGLTAKLRASKSVLRLGTLQPWLPIAIYNDTRLLPSTFQGGMFTFQEVEGLTVDAGRLTRSNLRDSSGRDEIGLGSTSSDAFDFVGGSYAINPQLAISYYYGQLDEIYRQQFIGLVHNQSLPSGFSLRSDIRYFESRGDGSQRAGEIDNRNLNGIFSISHGGHKVSAAWQTLSGNSAFPYLNGGAAYVVNLVTLNDFTRAEEDSWQLRYDYDFIAQGIPGLTFMTRYVDGRNARTATTSRGQEWERDTDLAYVVQSGSLKGLSLRWRNVSFRSGNGLATDIDENRLILGYTLALW
ncbi:OprD family porin [Pseudomonas sp. MMS21-TM103]|uniref:OprD family porin n=1 Tax=Pseudomonas sp. MMS21 TM103 TaxID=2886506 RepID=UPI001EDD23CC|nr:OprD family porin [Pseudomonas sp. MMS21 TM103]MCG4455267.1 OprD family porin [Pseudomonas sp. MMS21 TM103]